MFSTAFTVAPLIAALFVASPPAPTLVAAPTADAAESSRKVHVTVDVSELGSKGVGIDGLVIENLTPKLQEAGFEVVDGSEDAIELHVRFAGLRVDKFDYGLHFEFVDGEQAEPAIQWVACLLCVDANLLPLLDEQAPALVEALEKRVAASATAASDPDGNPTANVDDPPNTKPIKPLGPIGGVGIGVAALGLGAVVWGSVEISRGRVYDDSSNADPYRTYTDHGPRGRALLGAGVGGVVLGTALVVTDVVLRAKRRKQARKETGVLVPLVSPEGGGVGWVQRF